MRILHWTFALAVLLLLSSFGSGQERPAPPPELRQPTQVSAEQDITVFFDPNFPVTLGDVSEIIQSRRLAGLAIEALTGQPQQLTPAGHIGNVPRWEISTGNWYSAYVAPRRDLIAGESRGALPVRVNVSVPGSADGGSAAAEKYVGLIIKHLNVVLADLSRRAFDKKLDELKAASEEAREAAAIAEQKLKEMSAKLGREPSALSELVLQELVSDLTKQRQSLEVELAGMKGRAERLKIEVAKTSERRAKGAPDADEVVRNLERVLELRTKALKFAKQLHDTGAGSSAIDVAKAEEQVALAKVELAQAKQAMARPAGEQLEKLNSELSQIAISIAENQAKLEFIEKRLDEYEEVIENAAQTKALREQVDLEATQLVSLRQKADVAATRLRELSSSFRPARVEIFELSPGDDEKVEKK